MDFEKTFVLNSGRHVKIKIKKSSVSKLPSIFEVLVKDPNDKHFRSPICISHPKYWKYKSLNLQQACTMAVEFSGISDKQIKMAIAEFKKESKMNLDPNEIDRDELYTFFK